MKKPIRVLINLLSPPVIAAVFMFFPSVIQSHEFPDIKIIATVLMFAYLFAGIPSILHTILMEIIYSRGTSPTNGRAVLASSCSGLLSGVLVILTFVITSGIRTPDKTFWIYPIVGIAVGATTGFIILLSTRKKV
jgi:hypothetical protein